MDTQIKTASRAGAADAGRLQMLGQKAAMLAESAGLPLTEAVYRTVVNQPLNPIQIQRVVEFTNHEAFSNKYSALLGAPCTAVEFSAGPADPEVVLMRLEKEGHMQTSMPSADLSAYMSGPTKTSSLELVFEDFRTPEGLKLDQLRHLSLLKAAHEELAESVEVSRYNLDQYLDALTTTTKRALSEGADPARLVDAWGRVDASLSGPTADRVFGGITITKVATIPRPINPDHPVVIGFAAFSKEAHTYAHLRKGLLALESQMHTASAQLSGGR